MSADVINGKGQIIANFKKGDTTTETIEIKIGSFGFSGYFKINKKVGVDDDMLLYTSENITMPSSSHPYYAWKRAIIPLDNVNGDTTLSIDLFQGYYYNKQQISKKAILRALQFDGYTSTIRHRN